MTTETRQGARTGGTPADWRIIPLAATGVEVCRSPDPEHVSVGNPSLVAFPGGKLAVAVDYSGPGLKETLSGLKGRDPQTGHWLQGKVYLSNDKGLTWTARADYPFHQSRLFRVGSTLYLVGLCGNLRIMRSLDGGESWSKATDLQLPDNELIAAPANAFVRGDHVYLSFIRRLPAGSPQPGAGSTVPFICRARQGADLTNRKVWSVSEPGLPLRSFLSPAALEAAGLAAPPGTPQAAPRKGGRPADPAGPEWETPHLVELVDPTHPWHAAQGHAVHLLASGRQIRGNTAILARAVEAEADRLTLQTQPGAHGTPHALITLPGGSRPFDIAYDETRHLYWLVSNRLTDSLGRPRGPARGPRDAGQPGNPGPGAGRLQPDTPAETERDYLQLHYSRNLVDWFFAGCADEGAGPDDVRHSPRMDISGHALHFVCSAGRRKPGARGFTDRIHFHTIPAFRDLA